VSRSGFEATSYSCPMSDDAGVQELLELVPALRDRSAVSELVGGLTNTNYKVDTPDGAYVVRVSAKDAGMLAIDRENEYLNTVAAADAGVGAKVVDYVPERSLLVLEYIEGVTQTSEDLRRGDTLDMVAAACRRLHGARRFRDDFNMFRIQRRYLQLVQDRGFRLPERYTEFEPQMRQIEQAMSVRDEGTVPCNNDLLAENFIDTGGEFRLIDYEYSGNNDACFELGNVWSESNLSLDQLEQLVGHYYGRPLRNKVARARLWGLMSKYGWTLWASIQDGVSDIDFDFWEWGMEKYTRAVAEFDGDDFPRLLEDVQRAD
jgi:thiamine kinase-like enzyme